MEELTTYTQLKQHNIITQARYSMSALEMDVFFALLSVLDENDRTSKHYTIDVNTLEGIADKPFHSTRLKDVTESLIKRVYTLSQEDGSYLQLGLLSSARYVAEERKLILRVNPDMEEYLFDLKNNFTLYYLEYALRLNSKFSKRIYQMLSQFRSTGFFKTTIQKLKEQLELYDSATGEEQYKKVSAFRRYVLDVAQSELEQTDINFTYKLIKVGRSYKMIEFRFNNQMKQTKKADKVLEEVKANTLGQPLPTLHPEEEQVKGKRTLYERMTTDFELSRAHILSIFGAFDIKTINKELYNLKLEINTGKVSNKEAYTRKWFENLLLKRG